MSTVLQILTLLGCLGMFLFGMSLMSGGLQKMAGEKLRAFMATMTSNRFKCVLTGIIVTALVQSSTATTLMLVSFVNAGLLALANAIGVIMGANIGTTVTAWIFALSFGGSSFSLGAISIPLMFFAFLCFSSKQTKWKNFGEFLMGFALLFLGLSTLKETSTGILASDAVKNFLRPLTGFGPYYADAPMGSVLLFMVIGAAMTLMMQSSAATMALTMALVALGVIPFYMAAAMVLGENIGTTITSNIAASVANVSAKRTARAHMLFNVFGVAWVTAIFPWFLRLIGRIVAAFGFPDPVLTDLDTADGATREALVASLPFVVATIHTFFNVINTAILIWFIPQIEKIVKRLVPSQEGEKESFRLKYIAGGPLGTAELSVNEAQMEIIDFGRICCKGYGRVREAIKAHMTDAEDDAIAQLVKYEQITDNIEYEIATYLNEVTKGEISNATAAKIKRMYKIIGEMESLGDSGEAISRILTRARHYKQDFDESMRSKIDRMMDLVETAYQAMMDNLRDSLKAPLTDISNATDAEDAINAYRNALREEHIANLEKATYNYSAGVFYMDIVSELERIGDFIINISQAVYKDGDKK
jgi:phosphate:Na+ symporter